MSQFRNNEYKEYLNHKVICILEPKESENRQLIIV